MLFQGPVLTWVVLAAVLLGLPSLFISALGVSRVLPWKWPIVPFAIFLFLGFFSILAFALLLDSSGDTVVGEVLEKKEALLYHADGSWNRATDVAVKYRMSEFTPPVTETLSLRQARFDEMHNGDFVKLRVTEGPHSFRFTRLEDQHAYGELWDMATGRPFFFILTTSLIVLIAARLVFPLSVPIMFFLAGGCGIGAWWLSDVGLPIWEQVAIRLGPLDTVRANVREIHPSYFGAGARAWVFDKLFSHYQLILLDMTPLGFSEPLLSIDLIDPGTAALRHGDTITVQYSPGNPRMALVADATRNHVWRNAMVTTIFAVLALLLVVRVAFLIREQSEEEYPPEVAE